MHSGDRKAVFIPKDEEADRAAQKALQIAHNNLREACRLAFQAGWGNQIRADMASAESLVSHVRRAFQ